MGCRLVILIISIGWISACASSKVAEKKQLPRTMVDLYTQGSLDAGKEVAEFIDQHLKEQKIFGYVRPYIPVMNQPVVRKVWVPDHKAEDNPDVMVAGHWVYLMIQPPRWFIDETETEAKLPVIVPSVPEMK